jgi:hypothetical protein
MKTSVWLNHNPSSLITMEMKCDSLTQSQTKHIIYMEDKVQTVW